jgi:hypothetical protein
VELPQACGRIDDLWCRCRSYERDVVGRKFASIRIDHPAIVLHVAT